MIREDCMSAVDGPRLRHVASNAIGFLCRYLDHRALARFVASRADVIVIGCRSMRVVAGSTPQTFAGGLSAAAASECFRVTVHPNASGGCGRKHRNIVGKLFAGTEIAWTA